ncbi:MAG: hypothetical protein MZW92_62750 [Comamonadaceae bacterium]|nr:hypothetical protein [Comamonadaceae bacterium]
MASAFERGVGARAFVEADGAASSCRPRRWPRFGKRSTTSIGVISSANSPAAMRRDRASGARPARTRPAPRG